MSDSRFVLSCPGACGIEEIPVVSIERMREIIGDAVSAGKRVAGLFGDREADGKVRLFLAMMSDAEGTVELSSAYPGLEYSSFTVDFPRFHRFEREIKEEFGIEPLGHPWLKPLRYTGWAGAGDRAANEASGNEPAGPGGGNFYAIHGEEVHEVAVGPVHAGIIEPGHFRFNCRGEDVLYLEIALGYQHRGITRALSGVPGPKTIHYIETAAGDSTVAHTIAYAEVFEALSGCRPSPRAHAIRAIALELERIANHTGDLGALAGDVGYLPTQSFCGRLRGDILNLTATICGNRFGRGLVLPGGVGFDLEPERIRVLRERFDKAISDIEEAVGLIWSTPSVMARFEGCGPVTREIAEALGMVGPAARARGLERDSRRSHPSGAYLMAPFPVTTASSGDVAARAAVRRGEIGTSAAFIRAALDGLPEGELLRKPGAMGRNRFAVGCSEGWRGEIVHISLTNEGGKFKSYRIVDPSFRNWSGLAVALRRQEISDFPLCNKSFNLSYCGHDL